MWVLVDTNILLRAVQRNTPAGKSAVRALKVLHRQQHVLCIAPQNIIEFWNVCTRPIDVNGFGLSVVGAERYVKRLRRIFTVIHNSPQTFEKWHHLVVQYAVLGAKVHDAHLVAVMQTHGVNTVLTFNQKDFSRFDGVQAIHPDAVS